MSRKPDFSEEEQARELRSKGRTRQEQALSLAAQGWSVQTCVAVASYGEKDESARVAALELTDAYRAQISRRENFFEPHVNEDAEVIYLGSSGSPGRLWREEGFVDWSSRYGYGQT